MCEQEQSPDSCGDDDGNSKKKVKIETETGDIDWISKLPDALIVQILSLLPITDACRTTILSKRWQNLWTCIHNFIYKQKHDYSDSSTVNKFISFMDNVLPLLNCSSFKKFSLEFSFDYDDGMSYGPKIDELLEFAVNKNVEELRLNTWYIDEVAEYDLSYSLPQVLCSSSSILKIKCMHCRISEDCVLNWTSLKSLSLGHLYLRDEHTEQIMSKCPQLESFKLRHFCGFNRLHITSPKCTRLQLIDHYHPDGVWGSLEDPCGACCFEIVAPYVQHLEISGKFDRTKIRLGDLSSLVHADLTFCRDDVDIIGETLVEDLDLLVSIRSANELTVTSWFIKVISILVLREEDISFPLLECKWLAIFSSITEYSFPGIDRLLRSTPYLESLMIFPDMPGYESFLDEDIDLLEDVNLSLQQYIFKSSLQNLKNVKVISLFCSSITAELPHLLKFLLEHAINLEKLVIAPEHKGCNRCSTNMSELMDNLLAFPRASNSAVLSVGSFVPQNIWFNYI